MNALTKAANDIMVEEIIGHGDCSDNLLVTPVNSLKITHYPSCMTCANNICCYFMFVGYSEGPIANYVVPKISSFNPKPLDIRVCQ